MRYLVIFGLILLVLALNCEATEPVQLSGAGGQSTLMKIAGTAQFVNASANTGLWNWGGIPMGYALNQTGQLTPNQQVLDNDYGGWVPGV
jgi:hypothetical protein